MIVNEKKAARQKVGGYRWQHSAHYGSDKNGKGTLNYIGGVGKTYTALNFIILPYISIKSEISRTCTILVPRDSLVKQWQSEIREHIPSHLHHLIKVHTPNYILMNKLKFTTNLLVVDELHLFYSDEFRKVIDGTLIEFHHNLGLTATYDDPDGRHNAIESLYPIIDKIHNEEALREGYISRFFEYNLGLTLPLEDMKTYNEMSSGYDYLENGEMKHKKGISGYLAMFGSFGFDGVQKVLSGSYRIVDGEKKYFSGIAYASMWARKNGWSPGCDDDIDKMWNPGVIMGYAKSVMALVRARKDLLYNHIAKARASIEILKKYPDFKTISFSQSTEYADIFAGMCVEHGMPAVVYHTKLESRPLINTKTGQYFTYQSGAKKGQPKIFGKKKLKDFAIAAIKEGHSKIISTASALDVGFDVKDIRLGLIASRTTNFNKQKQRGYRTTRVDPYNPEHSVLIVNLYFINTKDVDWLKKAQSKSENQIYWVNSVEDITFDPQLFGANFD